MSDVTIHVTTAEIANPGESESIHEHRKTAFFGNENIGDETQIPMDDVQELSKLDGAPPSDVGSV